MLDNIVCAIEDFKRFSAANPKISPLKAYLLGMKYVYKNMDSNNIEFQDYILEINKILKECDSMLITSDSQDTKGCPFCGCKQIEFSGPFARETVGDLVFSLKCTNCNALVYHTIPYKDLKILAKEKASEKLFLKWNTRKEV